MTQPSIIPNWWRTESKDPAPKDNSRPLRLFKGGWEYTEVVWCHIDDGWYSAKDDDYPIEGHTHWQYVEYPITHK
jgi:hypothetical protein